MAKPIRHLFTITMLLVANFSFAQKTVITGKLVSDSTKEVVEGASISLINAKDSTVELIVLTDKKGVFEMRDIALGNYNILASSLGFTPYARFIKITEKKVYQMENMVLHPSVDTLDEVLVVGKRNPIVIKVDTIEYNADAFKTRPNATVEDLLKLIPGLEVEKDGSIKSEGKKITQVLVDGKPFFGDDPKMTTQNLPKDIVAKIQVIDEKSEQSKNTKVDDGERNKVLNIIIKKDKKKGVFGSAYLAAGTDDRREAKINANRFNQEEKMAIILMGNNTGRSDYGSGDGESSYYNNYSGITNEQQLRLTYSNVKGKKLDYNAGLSGSINKTTRENIRNRQTFFGDSSNYYLEQSTSTNKRKSMALNIGINWTPDTLTNIRFSQGGGSSESSLSSSTDFSSTSSNSGKRINEGSRNNSNTSRSPTFNGQLSYNRRFKKKGRNMFLNLNNNINSSWADNFNLSDNSFFPISSPSYQLLQNQLVNNNNRYTNISTAYSYNEPLSEKSSLSASYNFSYGKNYSLRETYDYNNLSQLYDLLNDSLSNTFNNYNYNHQLSLSYVFNWKKGGFNITARGQDIISKGKSVGNDSSYRQEFKGITPAANFYLNGKGKRFSVNYNYNIRQPQASQLQPVIDKSNPLYERLGNPDLKYAITHNIGFNLNYTAAKSGISLYGNGNVNITSNQITQSTKLDAATGKQTTQPINLDGASNTYTYMYAYFPLQKLGSKKQNKATLTVNMNFNSSKNVSLLNDEKNTSTNSSININTGIRFNLGEWLILNTSIGINRQNSSYSLKSNLNNINNSYTYTAGASIMPTKLTEININCNLSRYTGQSAGFNRKVNMLNAEVTQYFSHKRKVWMKLKGYDLLKQNVSIWRYAGDNYIEDTQSNVLTRYFLLSLNFRLNKFGGSTKRAG
jgi:hypothetical protein